MMAPLGAVERTCGRGAVVTEGELQSQPPASLRRGGARKRSVEPGIDYVGKRWEGVLLKRDVFLRAATARRSARRPRIRCPRTCNPSNTPAVSPPMAHVTTPLIGPRSCTPTMRWVLCSAGANSIPSCRYRVLPAWSRTVSPDSVSLWIIMTPWYRAATCASWPVEPRNEITNCPYWATSPYAASVLNLNTEPVELVVPHPTF